MPHPKISTYQLEPIASHPSLSMLITITSCKGGVGKSTSAVHLACCLAKQAPTLLVDGDPNRSVLKWAQRGENRMPFQVCSMAASPRYVRDYEHIVVDTPARPDREDLQELAEGCDLLLLPTRPDALSVDAMLLTVGILKELGCDHYRILLTMTGRSKMSDLAREALSALPLLKSEIRHYAAYDKATLEGCPVYEVKDDRNAKIAWGDYVNVSKELFSNGRSQ